MKNKAIFAFFVLTLMFTAGFGLKGCESKEVKQKKANPVTLRYWRVWDGPDAFDGIISGYKQQHPNVNISYRKLTYEEFESELIEAFATDKGPDIFSIHNTWMRKYQDMGLISPMPGGITLVRPILEGSLKKEIVWQQYTSKTPSLKDIKDKFVDTVYDDVVIGVTDGKTKKTENNIFGLPLSVDTLAMFYNKDLFNNAGITAPPAYWDAEFQQNVKKLTKQNNKGEIIQSGVALGGGDNIERSSDILAVLMMQGGAIMMSGNGAVLFHQKPEALKDRGFNPGYDAMRFYTDFSNPTKEVYCWNSSLGRSTDLFVQGKLAMIFGYAYMLPQIRAYAPKLNFGITALPQIKDNTPANFANYWVEVVSSKTKNKNEAWDFLIYATKAEQAKLYLDKVKKPTALRSLVEEQKEDHDIGPFVGQVLTAKSWYRGVNANAAETVIKEMIDEAVAGQKEMDDVLEIGARKVQQTIKSKKD